ncbi:hypothetical protein LSTR_LSTR006258 [Laodelphax striatellus]|uniref:Uncharacterized protein n=1 Tax=Laodelphax striatellus TaxID=195883 RepID=A0A482WHM2_LAOST|nr:hypothetical protein LSTR_LSTR006258 [Laodelphax striatellus]
MKKRKMISFLLLAFVAIFQGPNKNCPRPKQPQGGSGGGTVTVDVTKVTTFFSSFNAQGNEMSICMAEIIMKSSKGYYKEMKFKSKLEEFRAEQTTLISIVNTVEYRTYLLIYCKGYTGDTSQTTEIINFMVNQSGLACQSACLPFFYILPRCDKGDNGGLPFQEVSSSFARVLDIPAANVLLISAMDPPFEAVQLLSGMGLHTPQIPLRNLQLQCLPLHVPFPDRLLTKLWISQSPNSLLHPTNSRLQEEEEEVGAVVVDTTKASTFMQSFTADGKCDAATAKSQLMAMSQDEAFFMSILNTQQYFEYLLVYCPNYSGSKSSVTEFKAYLVSTYFAEQPQLMSVAFYYIFICVVYVSYDQFLN